MKRFKEILKELPKGMMSAEMLEAIEDENFTSVVLEDHCDDEEYDGLPDAEDDDYFSDDYEDYCPYCGELYEDCDCDEAREDPYSPNYRGYARNIN